MFTAHYAAVIRYAMLRTLMMPPAAAAAAAHVAADIAFASCHVFC